MTTKKHKTARQMLALLVMGCATGALLTACEDYFDDVPENADSLESVFANRGQTLDWLTNIYGYIPDNTNRYAGGTAMFWGPATLEGYLPWDWVETHDIIHGTINTSSSFVERIWKNYYEGIQYANIYLANVDNCQAMTQAERDWSKAECRALRALFYFNLMKLYGPVPIVGDAIYSVDQPLGDMTLPRATVDECFDYILTELDATLASGHLVSQFNDGSYDARMKGNLTAEAVEGLRAEVLLYRASFIFNGDSYYQQMQNADGTKLFPQGRDDQKWREARDAAKRIIDSGKFRLVLRDREGKLVTNVTAACPYKSVFYASMGSSDNEEMIYGRTSSARETYSMIPRFGNLSSSYDKGGGAYTIPLQFVDLYFTNEGLRIDDEGSGYFTYDTSDPQDLPARNANAIVKTGAYSDPISGYTYFTPQSSGTVSYSGPTSVMKQFYDREARFYLAVTFQNRNWEFDKNVAVQMQYNGNSGSDGKTHDYPIFGTINRKLYYSKESNWDMAITLRLGEVYLNYAEACAELGDTEEALRYVNLIRSRAGIREYRTTASDDSRDARGKERIALPAYNRDQVLKVIYRERILELSYEDKHYFDVRRWGVGEGKWRDGTPMTDSWIYPSYHEGGEGGQMIGFNVNNTGQTDENKNVNFYKRVVQDTRVYTKRMSLFPIPQTEVNRDKAIVQNAGWTTEE